MVIMKSNKIPNQVQIM